MARTQNNLIRNCACLLAVLALSGCGDWNVVNPITAVGEKNFLFLIGGIRDTIAISIYSIVIGSLIGLAGAFARRSRKRWLVRAVGIYVELLRSLPLFVVLLWIYFAVPIAMRDLPESVADWPGISLFVHMDAFTATVIGLSLNSGAFMIEIFRAGIESVSRGQIDAGIAFGMSRQTVMRRIVLPQAVRRMLPPVTSQFISITKDSSLGMVLGVLEITRRASELQTQILHPMEIYTFLALEYLLIVQALSLLARYLERRFPQHH